MCGRFAFFSPEEAIRQYFDLNYPAELSPSYNIAPSQQVAAILESPVSGIELQMLQWGLVPFWAKDPKIGHQLINARAETLSEKPSFRQAFVRRRCLIPANGFYEWHTEGGEKRPLYFSDAESRPFFMAGLWELWISDDGSEIESCTLLTTEPNDFLAPIHNRMPVIIAPDDFDLWLDPGAQHPGEVQHLLRAYPAEAMSHYPVSTFVNNPRNEDPLCIEPLIS
jgi:putative SOS response-associated peptidase YedK